MNESTIDELRADLAKYETRAKAFAAVANAIGACLVAHSDAQSLPKTAKAAKAAKTKPRANDNRKSVRQSDLVDECYQILRSNSMTIHDLAKALRERGVKTYPIAVRRAVNRMRANGDIVGVGRHYPDGAGRPATVYGLAQNEGKGAV